MIKYYHTNRDGLPIISRQESREYIEQVILKYQDGSSTVINPTEE